jgi:DNA-binding NtrC family response regulator
MVEALFGREGHTVEVARAAPQVLDLLRERAFDLVIVDARAAAPGGERLLVEELVERLPAVRARILVANGDVQPSTEHTLRRLGVPYVRKPFNLRDLRSAAARVWAAGARS